MKMLNFLFSASFFSFLSPANSRCFSYGSLDHPGAPALHPGGGCRQGGHRGPGETFTGPFHTAAIVNESGGFLDSPLDLVFLLSNNAVVCNGVHALDGMFALTQILILNYRCILQVL